MSLRTMYKYLFIGIFITIIAILSIIPVQVLGLENGYARIVYNVSGIQDYKLHWNDRFPPGSTLSIYTEANGINHRHMVGIDYIFIIKDSNDNIIDTSVLQSRFSDNRANDYVIYSKMINESWDDGAYTADIHIFDLLNDSAMRDYYNNLTSGLLNQSPLPDIPYTNRSNITTIPSLETTQHKEIIQNFYIDRYADKYPANRFMIDNMNLDKLSIAPGEPVQISANITNTFYDAGSVIVELNVDNSTIDNQTININPFSSKTISMTIPSEITSIMNYGNHAIELVPITNYTEGFNLTSILNILKREIEIPIQIIIRDIQTNKLRVNVSEPITINVTAQNNGKAGSQSIDILINNVPIEPKIVDFKALETKDINFTVVENEPGEYKITANNTNFGKIFIVQTEGIAPVPTPPPIENKIPNILMIIGLSILLVFTYLVRKNLRKKLKILTKK